ncbi:hypothetical protein J2Z79_000457 [Symbiobacterium terraclitae]|uniref:Uncharacterized protein n=1 Tax=Symbiobacterium terraclitae TaxID=557451 RepID=A0ABS4JNH4_9FIRM|nr:hypothetical protein [Symbiobacterium terraclitae]MBP2017083.1 hypothetical protein [Symbiobacterium terraclitae]
MAEEPRAGKPGPAKPGAKMKLEVEPLHDDGGEEHPRTLLQQMYEQSGEARRPRQ